MSQKNRFKIENLTRFLIYVIGHKPYEFGLVPDHEGFFTYKDLLQAIHEESGWSYVGQSNINQVLLSKDRSLFQSDEKRIRAVNTLWTIDLKTPAISLAKILFTGIRTKAHLTVMDKGLRAIEGSYHVLSQDRDMADRIGRRKDQQPVILEIGTETALTEGIRFYSFGDLYLTKEISPRYIAGPPVSKDVLKAKEAKEAKAAVKKDIKSDFHPGTFVIEVNRDLDRSRTSKGKKRIGWKEEARKLRRRKH